MITSKIRTRIKNSKGVIKDLSWTLVSQVLGNLLRFLLIFVVIRCYSKEEFGLWASITSIAAVIITGDFGLTNVLRNIASKGIPLGKSGEYNTQNAWLSAFVFLSLFAVLGMAVLYIIKDLSIFEFLFKTDNEQLKSLGSWITIVVIGIFLLNLPFGLASGLFYSYGEVKETCIFGIASDILTFISVVILSIVGTRIDIVSIVYFLCPLLVRLFSTLFFLRRRHWNNFDFSFKGMKKHIIEMIPAGLGFVGIGFSRSFIPNALTIFSGAMLGLSVAANINVATKIYSFFSGIMIGFINPIWGRLSRLFYSKEYSKCRLMYRYTLLGMFVGAAVIVLCATAMREGLVQIIAGGDYKADVYIFLLVGTCLFGKVIYDSASLLLIATNNLKIIIIGYVLFCCVVMFAFPEIIRVFGFNWMMLSMTVCWIIFISLIIYKTKKELTKAESEGKLRMVD